MTVLVALNSLRNSLTKSSWRSSLPKTAAILSHSRLYSAVPEPRFKDTTPSTSKPSAPGKTRRNADEGYLSFTKSSLYKLTLPLTTSPTLPSPKIGSGAEKGCGAKESNNGKGAGDAWEELVEKGNHPFVRQDASDEKRIKSLYNAIFLLHPGQPLSYIANLIRAEAPHADPEQHDETDRHSSESKFKPNPLEELPVTFRTPTRFDQHWSPSTGIGDFLREAARLGSFTITIGSRHVRINVPTFEERTRFLRAALHEKTKRIEDLAHVKDECDRIARQTTQRYAFAGAGVMSCWWVTVGILTFKTDLGWDVMEPITYLTGFGMAIGGYIWFLWHNREVSYRTVLTETTSRRQQKLYEERGFDIDSYQVLIAEVKGLRRAVKRVAWDYGLEWDQGDTEVGRSVQRALQIVRREEELDRRRKHREDDDEKEEDEALAKVDNDGDGKPDKT